MHNGTRGTTRAPENQEVTFAMILYYAEDGHARRSPRTVTTLEETERTFRRVFGGAPATMGIGVSPAEEARDVDLRLRPRADNKNNNNTRLPAAAAAGTAPPAAPAGPRRRGPRGRARGRPGRAATVLETERSATRRPPCTWRAGASLREPRGRPRRRARSRRPAARRTSRRPRRRRRAAAGGSPGAAGRPKPPASPFHSHLEAPRLV